MNWDTPSHHGYSSWTDKELYIAVETDPACADEYIAELQARAAERAAHALREKRVNEQYGITG